MLTAIRPLLDDLKPQRHSSRVLYVLEEVRPVIDRSFTLAEAVDALAYQAEGHARGKTIVAVS